MLKTDRYLIKHGHTIFEPFQENLISKVKGKNKISYGVSSYGYDIRLDYQIKVFSNLFNGIVDPKNFEVKNITPSPLIQDETGAFFILPPHSFSLGNSLEKIKIPRDCLALCIGKSTYARCGLIVNATPSEPEWEGFLTLEFSNTTNLPIKIYAGEGIAQLLFIEGSLECKTSYKDRNGKYQNQKDITYPKV